MRLATDDVTRSLRASWRLMDRGAEALPELDLSREGFWRSYLALALTAPAIIPVLAAERILTGLSNTGSLFDAPSILFSVVAAQLLVILALPALLIALAPNLLRSPRLTSFIIAWNWTGILSAGLMAIPAAVFALGWSTYPLAVLQGAAFGIIVLRLRYGVARAAFGKRGGLAAMILCASLLADYAVIRSLGLMGL